MKSNVLQERAITEDSGWLSYPMLMFGVLTLPVTTFKVLNQNVRWVLPFLLCVVIATVQLAMTERYRMDDMRRQIASDSNMSEKEMARRLNNIEASRKTTLSAEQVILAFAVVGGIHGIKVFGLALAIWLSLQLLSQEISYVKTLALCSFSYLVNIPEALIRTPLIIAKESTHVYLGAAALVPDGWQHSPLFRLSRQFELSTIWICILLVIGIYVMTNLTRRQAVVIIGSLFSLWTLLTMLVGDIIQIV